jgi:N-methylhydantoinase B
VDLGRRIEIRVAVTIEGSEICFDFSGTSPQTAGPVNAVMGATIAGAYYVIRTLADPSIPNNAGCYRMARFVLPPESVVNPRHPAPVNARAVTIARVADAIAGALVKAVPTRLTAGDSGHNTMAFGGVDPETRGAFVTSEMGAGGSGARFDKDGIDVLDFGVVNCMNIPVEAFEMESPLRVESFGLRTDSGGAGRTRGGLGYEKVFVAQSNKVIATMRGERFFTQPWGIFGGHAAQSADAWVERAGGGREPILSKRVVALDRGDRLVVRTAGGGGYGPPAERPVGQVLDDVADGKVSVGQAEETYGVIIVGGAVDRVATEKLRARLGAGTDAPTFDHGRHGKSENGLSGAPCGGVEGLT